MSGEYIVDTPIFLDILENDPVYGASSAALLDRYADSALFMALISYFELAPAFNGQRHIQDEFMQKLGVTVSNRSVIEVTPVVYRSWGKYYEQERAKGRTEFPFVVCLIGALACSYDGIITRRGDVYRAISPNLNVITG